MIFTLHSVVWWLTYVINFSIIFTVFIYSPWNSKSSFANVAVERVCLCTTAIFFCIVISDIFSEWMCIFIAFCRRPRTVVSDDDSQDPAIDPREGTHVLVYCLKSNGKEDIKETLRFLRASQRMNIEYPVVYCILSGTKDGLIAMNEAQEIDNFNALNSFSVKYVRRTRSILYKYGQYLDFIMLLNGHKSPILYTEDVPSHVSGEVFEPSRDVDYFCNSSFELLTIMDRDNILGTDYFQKMDALFLNDPTIEVYTKNASIYEDFPLTHVEWHIRQQRWDLGDMIISKYVYPFSFGLLPNILSGFSNSQTFGVYSNGSLSKQRIVYNSTFNIRAAYVKFFTLLSMIATYFCDFEDSYGTFAILGWINLQMVIVPVAVSIIVVRAMSWREVIVTQLLSIYIGTVDIFYGSFRLLWALGKLLTRSKGWTTYESLGNSPLGSLKTFCMCCGMELLFAAAVFGLVLWQMIKTNSTEKLAILIFMGLVLTFPFYVLISSYKRGITIRQLRASRSLQYHPPIPSSPRPRIYKKM
jgi:hypothetical protein